MRTILVDDYDRGIEYFTQILGFTLMEDTQLSPDKRWVVIAPHPHRGASILLARASSPEQEENIGFQTAGRVAYFLYTDDFEVDYSKMRSLGVQFIEEPRQETFGKVVVFQDIYGNKWDFIQRSIR